MEKQILKHRGSEFVTHVMSVRSVAPPQPLRTLGVVMSGGVPGKGSQTLLLWPESQNSQPLKNP